jgi:response regulator of citrate/malate metabolism
MEKEKKVILVIEDERPLAEAIKLTLEKNNFEVVTTRTVSQAKDYVNDIEKIDVIWLDHYLIGKETGLDFVSWCKNDKNPKCLSLPIFVVSNTASADKVTTYMSLGVNKYFIKSNHKLNEIIEEISKSIL